MALHVAPPPDRDEVEWRAHNAQTVTDDHVEITNNDRGYNRARSGDAAVTRGISLKVVKT